MQLQYYYSSFLPMATAYRIPLGTVASCVIDLSVAHMKEEVFRFIDCKAFIEDYTLSIFESSALPAKYATISYPWKGNSLDQTSPLPPNFRVAVADDSTPGDPISIDVLRSACIAIVGFDLRYLWFDQVCMLQKSKKDKRWQIMHMGNIYKECTVCFVLPGGLQRLVGLDESTSWIQRAWTLQEATVSMTICIFAWTHGNVTLWGLTSGSILEIEKGRSAAIELGEILQAGTVGSLNATSESGHILSGLPVKIFGKDRDPILALMGVIELKDQCSRETSIWRSALMRTSQQEVDMVFSIMGLFGVTLDPKVYVDRASATLGLAEAVMANGGRATWLVASMGSNHLPNMCTMPEFPISSVSGGAWYNTPNGVKAPWEVIGSSLDWAVTPSPKGQMDDSGSFLLTSSMASVQVLDPICKENGRVETPFWSGFHSVALLNGRNISVKADFAGSIDGTHAILLGEIRQFMLPATAARASKKSIVILLLVPNHGRWHKTGLAVVEKEFTQGWEMRKVAIGHKKK
jgi:hypothetical protein